MKHITIIGAGLSGTLLAINLLRQKSSEQIYIKLIDRNSEGDLGPAYSTNENYLLNVPAEIMGAFSVDKQHFLKWAVEKNISAAKGDYLPRKLYRQYIQEIFQQALNEKNDSKFFKRILGEAVDVKINNGKPVVYTQDGSEFVSDKVVLALGNAPPLNPQTTHQSFLKDERYIQNPWDPAIFDFISPDDSILFIGTGQTTIDLATGLYKRKHKGELISISRRGFFPLVQKKVEPYPSFFDELNGLSDILSVFRVVRKHFRIAKEKGFDPRAVIDSIRPDTKAIWMHLSVEEKKRFLRHVFRYWEIIRSRIPPVSDEIINNLKATGQLKIFSGRITDITSKEDKMEVEFIKKGTSEKETVSTDVVINCIGPCQDYERIDQPLIKNLLGSKLIQCDPVHLGINALPEGHVIKEEGTPSDIIYTIGLPLKGIVWESLALPEIRAEAEDLSKMLLAKN
jgi:uncharacterized NAD(P)/FAD-binding protein YdhS